MAERMPLKAHAGNIYTALGKKTPPPDDLDECIPMDFHMAHTHKFPMGPTFPGDAWENTPCALHGIGRLVPCVIAQM